MPRRTLPVSPSVRLQPSRPDAAGARRGATAGLALGLGVGLGLGLVGALLTVACASDGDAAGRETSNAPLIDQEGERQASSSHMPVAELAAPPVSSQEDSAPVSAASPPRPPATIYRDEIDRATNGGRPAYLLRQLKPVAHRPRGKFLGWEIQEVWPEDPDLAAQCDLRAGDVIVAVNGLSMEFPDDMAKLMKKLETATELRVRRLRNGRLEEKAWTIVDDRP